MNWTVTYKPSAKAELTDLWLNAADRAEITSAANRVDTLLSRDPYNQDESREGTVRIMFEHPLMVEYKIFDDDRMVEVVRVSRYPN